MTVNELIEKLKTLPGDMIVVREGSDGYEHADSYTPELEVRTMIAEDHGEYIFPKYHPDAEGKRMEVLVVS